MNDILNASQMLYNILYADDTCIYLSGKDLHAFICTMNTEVNRIVVWLKSNTLVTMTLFSTRTVTFLVQVAYWIPRVVAPT